MKLLSEIDQAQWVGKKVNVRSSTGRTKIKYILWPATVARVNRKSVQVYFEKRESRIYKLVKATRCELMD